MKFSNWYKFKPNSITFNLSFHLKLLLEVVWVSESVSQLNQHGIVELRIQDDFLNENLIIDEFSMKAIPIQSN